jgi:hypothetical protein
MSWSKPTRRGRAIGKPIEAGGEKGKAAIKLANE